MKIREQKFLNHSTFEDSKKPPSVWQAYDDTFIDKRVNSLLEFGVGNGQCLRRIKATFPDALVVGVDKRIGMGIQGVQLFECRQENTEKLDGYVGDMRFDVIIDDCAHQYDAARSCFEYCWDKLLNPGGYYCLEAWARQYGDNNCGTPFHQFIHELIDQMGEPVWRDYGGRSEFAYMGIWDHVAILQKHRETNGSQPSQ